MSRPILRIARHDPRVSQDEVQRQFDMKIRRIFILGADTEQSLYQLKLLRSQVDNESFILHHRNVTWPCINQSYSTSILWPGTGDQNCCESID